VLEETPNSSCERQRDWYKSDTTSDSSLSVDTRVNESLETDGKTWADEDDNFLRGGDRTSAGDRFSRSDSGINGDGRQRTMVQGSTQDMLEFKALEEDTRAVMGDRPPVGERPSCSDRKVNGDERHLSLVHVPVQDEPKEECEQMQNECSVGGCMEEVGGGGNLPEFVVEGAKLNIEGVQRQNLGRVKSSMEVVCNTQNGNLGGPVVRIVRKNADVYCERSDLCLLQQIEKFNKGTPFVSKVMPQSDVESARSDTFKRAGPI